MTRVIGMVEINQAMGVVARCESKGVGLTICDGVGEGEGCRKDAREKVESRVYKGDGRVRHSIDIPSSQHRRDEHRGPPRSRIRRRISAASRRRRVVSIVRGTVVRRVTREPRPWRQQSMLTDDRRTPRTVSGVGTARLVRIRPGAPPTRHRPEMLSVRRLWLLLLRQTKLSVSRISPRRFR